MKPIAPDTPGPRALGKIAALGAIKPVGKIVALGTIRRLGEKPDPDAGDARPLDVRMNENVAQVEGYLRKADELTAMEKIDIALHNETEIDYWCAVVFQTSAQRTAFLLAVGMQDDTYIDGEELAGRLKIALPARPTAWKKPKVSQRLAAMALEV